MPKKKSTKSTKEGVKPAPKPGLPKKEVVGPADPDARAVLGLDAKE